MPDRGTVIDKLNDMADYLRNKSYSDLLARDFCDTVGYAIALLKEQEKKQIILHKKHTITWGRNDEFSMRKLYEAICETLIDEGELFVARADDHEKVDFVFYVTEGR